MQMVLQMNAVGQMNVVLQMIARVTISIFKNSAITAGATTRPHDYSRNRSESWSLFLPTSIFKQAARCHH